MLMLIEIIFQESKLPLVIKCNIASNNVYV